ncbi:PD-(D/E)XK nuclease family protein [Yersinia enterocolitica]|uniref:PD-(D/E)XK nuclease family protein n=1 Tax=Yersinia TaxID=629 RepID=UPI000E06DF85|nr:MULTISPECIES: PD-(D/E)XK nuclease family protein [Yersinia]EKN6393076.1 hypothetical protein [Yersinia enterocolitica]ELX2269155.1 PD-(D/E)XK nuclease family protein [Yersinia enterocolitica]SUP90410.1 PD-(D/E)XK nuclease superfamily [Yersinia pseudotuberculosis]HDL6677045.1 PD-(D/E)XK nuclease family protein [Yersinia enterocolitica]HDL8232173.1 PD-(D/E)XK nuclease family protein [Yersinia enterocolitica]
MNIITRTRPALPSKLGVFVACPLRYLLESEQHTLQCLPLHPRTILGSVVHRLVNTLKKGPRGTSTSMIGQLENTFINAIGSTQRPGPLTEWVLKRHGIAGLISRKTLLEQIRYANSLIIPSVEREKYLPDSPEKRENRIPVGREQPLTSALLNMSGRADLIYQIASDQLRIVDFKTGKVTDAPNQPKDHYLLQVAAYGMMVKEWAPSVHIELELAGIFDNWTGFLDASLHERIAQILIKLNNTLPLNVPLYPQALAQSGKHCTTCISRCSCSVYRGKLQQHLQQHRFDPVHFGYDISGRLIDVDEDDGLITLRVQLDNGFTVKVFRIPTQLFPELERMVGRYLSMYGANRLGRSSEGNFPRNFYVIDTQNPNWSAFQFCLQWE